MNGGDALPALAVLTLFSPLQLWRGAQLRLVTSLDEPVGVLAVLLWPYRATSSRPSPCLLFTECEHSREVANCLQFARQVAE